VKIIKSGSYYRFKKETSSLKGLQVIKDMRFAEIKIEKKRRVERSINRSRQKIREVLNNNLDDYSWFITITFKENLQDVTKATNYLNLYIKRNFNDLKYLVVKERQERGAIHFHLVVFGYNVETAQAYQDFKQWKHGLVFVKRIRFKNATAISNYFTKYLGKENQLIDTGKRIYSTSKNLKQSIEYNHMIYQYIINKFGYDFDINNLDLENIDLVDLAKNLFDCPVINELGNS